MSAARRGPRRYAVILKGPVLPPVGNVAAVLARRERAPLADVARRVRAARGILEEDLAKEPAQELARELSDNGLPALAVPKTLLEDVPAFKPLARAGLERAGLRGLDGARPALLPWKSLSVIAAGAIAQSVPRPLADAPTLNQQLTRMGYSLLTGLPLSLRPRREPKRTSGTELFFYADLVWREPARRLRIDGARFDYSCLSARMGYGSAGNFKRLLAEAARRAPGALATHGARALLEGRAPAEPGYGSLGDLEREARWLLSLRALALA